MNSINCLPDLFFALFIRNVEPMMDDRGCWEWTGERAGQMRYGLLTVKIRGRKHRMYAHRYSWQLHHGGQAVPKDMFVLHSCDNPTCVNPAHLDIGTKSQNTQGMLARGRGKWSGYKRQWRVLCGKCGKMHSHTSVAERCLAGRYHGKGRKWTQAEFDARVHEGIE